MKTPLHKFNLLGVFLLTSYMTYSQSPPTGSPPAGNTAAQAAAAWYRGGNTISNGNNIFGTMWNSPIYTVTDGVHRMRLNGTFTTNINGVNQNVDGFLGLGVNSYFATNSPWSMLHLEGPNNTNFGGSGWRKWMRTGIFMKENSDAMYVGLKQETGTNRSDAVISWSDDPVGAGSVDKLRFIFTGICDGNGNGVVNPITGQSLNGYEFMRMQPISTLTNSSGFPVGHVGIGPLFTDALPPQSRLHLHAEDNLSNYTQWTNQGTAQAAFNGLRAGILGNSNALINGTGLLYNQENRALLFSTGANTQSVNGINTFERVRVMAYNTPTALPTGGFGIYTPSTVPANTNITRMSISHDPSQPITRPLSLLHLGYNTTGIISPLNGWRSWMDVGIYTSQGTDNMYIGLKREPSSNPLNQGDRYDAVINWGDNMQNPLLQEGPDNLRFIFTSGVNDPLGTTQSRSANGVEVMRLTPNNLVNNPQVINKPSVGIGDFTGIPIDANNYVGATLDVDGDARIRSVQQNESLNQVLVRDPNDYGRLYWRDANNLTGAAINANNGCSIDPLNANTVQFGQNINAAGNPAQLLNYREVPMNNQNIYFLGQNATTQGVNAMGIGYPNNVTNLPAKLSVWEDPGAPVAFNTVGVLGRNSSASPALNGPFNYNRCSWCGRWR